MDNWLVQQAELVLISIETHHTRGNWHEIRD
jgi:hypothetical protein